jgi:hypothetical protein
VPCLLNILVYQKHVVLQAPNFMKGRKFWAKFYSHETYNVFDVIYRSEVNDEIYLIFFFFSVCLFVWYHIKKQTHQNKMSLTIWSKVAER